MIGRISRVIQLEQEGAARKTKAGAISSGWAARFIGVSAPNWATFSADLSAGLSGVPETLLAEFA